MSIEAELRGYVLNDSGVQAILAQPTGLWWEYLPQAPELPALRYQRVSGERVPTLDGPSGFVAARFQFDAYARNMETAEALAAALITCLDSLQKTALVMYFVDSTLLESDQDLSTLEGDRRHRRRSLDFVIRYRGA